MTRTMKPLHTECRKCPFYQYQECLIASSRILTYFYCLASEGYRGFDVVHSRRNGSSTFARANLG